MKRIRSLSGRVLIALLLVVFVIFIFLTGVLFYWSYERVRNEYRQITQAYAANVDGVFSGYVEDARSLAEEIYDSSEGVGIRYSKSYDVMEGMGLRLDLFGRMEPFYQSIFVLNDSGEVSFQTRNGISFPAHLEQELESYALDQGIGSPPFVWQIESRHGGEDKITLLSLYIQEGRIEDKYYAGSVIVNMDAKYLSKELFHGSVPEGVQVLIIDHDGMIVASNNESCLGQMWSQQSHVEHIREDENGAIQTKIDGEEAELIYRKTRYNGFYVIVQSEYNGGVLDAMQLLPVSIMIIAFIFTIMLVYFICIKLFRPLNALTANLREESEAEYGLDIKKIYDDVQFLESYHRLTSNYVQKLRLQEDKNIIVQGLLQGCWNQDMQKFMVDKKMLVSGMGYCVAILQLGTEDEPENEYIVNCKQRREIVSEIFEDCLKHLTTCTSFELGLRKVLLILSDRNGKKIQRDALIKELEIIRWEVSREQHIEVNIAVSDYDMQQKINCDVLFKQAMDRLEGATIVTGESTTKNDTEANTAEGHTNQELIEKIVDYLNENYRDKDINVSVIAKKFYISNAYLGRLFQEFTGKSMPNYLLDIRMKKARDILMTCPEMPVSQVAEEVGYNNNAYFATSFRKYYGVSPSKIWDFSVGGSEQERSMKDEKKL